MGHEVRGGRTRLCESQSGFRRSRFLAGGRPGRPQGDPGPMPELFRTRFGLRRLVTWETDVGSRMKHAGNPSPVWEKGRDEGLP
jgi:hypothetical protein